MRVRALLAALATAAVLAVAACDSEPGQPPRNEAPKSDDDRDVTTLYVVDAVDAQTAFAYGTNDEDFTGSVVLKTSDGGAHWRAVLRASNSELVGLDFADASNGVAITDGGAVLVTSDGGETWSARSDPALLARRFEAPSPSVGGPATQPGPAELEGVAFAGALDGWAFGSREERAEPANASSFAMRTRPVVYRTSDGGATWAEAPVGRDAPDMALRRGFFADAKNGVLVGGEVEDEPTGVVLRTGDGGATWQVVTPNVAQVPTSVFFVDANRGWLVGATEDDSGDAGPSQILTTADGGRTWQPQARVPTSLRSIRFVDAQNGWAVGARGKIFRTSDGGATWAEQTEQDWTTGQTLEVEDPEFPGDDAPTFYGLTLLAPGRGWAVADVGVYEYRAR